VTNIVRSGATLRLGYNAADQLVAVTNGATWTTYTHDGGGRRTVSTNSAGMVRRFLTAPTPGTDLESPHLVANGSGTFQQGYVFLGEEPLLRFDSAGNPVYYLEDAMGSVVGLVSNATSIATFSYDGFGNFRSVSGTTNAPTGTGGDFRFHGLWLETDNGLYHIRARDYDSRTGRFLSRDPVDGDSREPESFQPYSFANGNPYYYTDRTGEFFTIIEFNLVGAIQNGLGAIKAYGVNRARRFAIDKLQEAITDLATQPLVNLLPIDLGDAFQGFEFERKVRQSICGALGDPDEYFYFEVGINRKGTPLGAGVTCNNIEEDNHRVNVSEARRGIRNTRGTAYAEMIIGPRPPKEGKAYPHSWVIAEIKRSSQTAYDDYIAGRKAYQFDNFALYASKHTYSRTLVVLIAKRTPGNRYKTVAPLLMKKALGHGAFAYVDVIGEGGGKRRRR
jgi:RHS repeat-associated protein